MSQSNQSELEKRHKAEKTFHDQKFSQEAAKNFYELGFKSIIFNDLLEKIGDLTNKKVLDFGCGSGWQSKIFAGKGADVWAFDISEEAAKQANQLVNKLHLSNKVHVHQMAAEKLSFQSNKFDMVIGNAILHHLDVKLALDEIHRILRRGGKAYFLEPLGHNPLVNLYRKFTPVIRTKDEVPLRIEYFEIIRKKFSRFNHDEYYLLTLMSFFWYFIIRNDKLLLRTRTLLFKLDRMLLKIFPHLKKYCWYTILEMEK
jgi:ubiquinone/menaquinone biosynthesis C-methylase UbiE